MLAINSLNFVLILLIAPIILHFLRNKTNKISAYFFLVVNLAVYLLTLQNILQALILFFWLLIPYFYLQFFSKKSGVIIFLLLGFLYLNKYDWIVQSLGIPYLFTFRIFGLSYILFRQIDFILQYDVNKAELPRITLLTYLNYLLSFYTIISGPIQRFAEFIVSFEKRLPPLETKELLSTLNRILNGYLKIFILSYYCNKIAGDNFQTLQQSFNFVALIIFAFVNVAYIYFNFSGFCDVVIGFAKIAGIILPENFNKPYLAQDINDFWGRQHITLTRWITDYVFNPFVRFLSSKGIGFNQAMNISFFAAFLFAGLWHGSTLNYLVYGLLQAIGVCLTQLYLALLKKQFKTRKAIREHRNKLPIKVIEIAITQTYIAGSFIFIGYDIIGTFF